MEATADKTYNGWTNYETWAVGMYLDGNYDGEGTYRYVLDLVRDSASGNAARRGEALRAAAIDLQEWFEETLPDLGASIAADLLRSAVDEINWRELAEAKLQEVAENDGPAIVNSDDPNAAD